ncbi:MAG: hypothetical protein ACE37K_18145 [Planctomycetota bacterium]|jgi:hypothetical protein
MLRLALLACALAAPAGAQSVEVLVRGTERHGDIVTGKHGMVLPAGEFSVAELIEATAGYLCRNYLYDPNVVMERAPFRLQRELALDALGSEEVLYALLSTRNLAALPLDERRGLYQVVPLEPSGHSHPMSAIPWRRPQDVLRRPHYRELVMTTVSVDHVDAQHVASGLRSHFAMMRQWQPGAPTIAFVGERSLILHGYADQIAQTIQAIGALDQMAAPRVGQPDQPRPDGVQRLMQRLDALEREVRELKRQLADKK